jgi:hypothetical protein
LIIPLLLAGCAGAGGLLGNDDDDSPGYAADTFYKMLMWKYYEKAAVFVHPESKSDFDRFVYESKDDLNITQYQIKDIIAIEDGDKEESVIRTYVTYYKYPSVSEVQEIQSDVWVNEGGKWFIKSKFDSGMYR